MPLDYWLQQLDQEQRDRMVGGAIKEDECHPSLKSTQQYDWEF